MSQPANILSALALVLAVVVAVRGEVVRREQATQQRKAAHEQRLLDVRETVNRLSIRWMHSHLSHDYVVRDDNWPKLLESVQKWRDTLAAAQQDALADSENADDPDIRTRPYWAFGRMATAARVFETELWELIQQWQAATEYQDPSPGRLRLTAAVETMQSEFRQALEELDDLHGEDLVRPIAAQTAELSIPVPAAVSIEAFPRERGRGSLPT